MVAESQSKPLVLVSAAEEDQAWLERLQAADRTHLVEWGKLSSLESDILRASLVVPLVSPAYLASDWTRREFSLITHETRSRGLKVLPILVEECDWRQLDILRGVAWSGVVALAGLPPVPLAEELQRIVNLIGVMTREGERSFSNAAGVVMDTARSLANRARRESVTSSCLLFAIAESSTVRGDTSAFVRNYLNRRGTYDAILQQFLGDAKESQGTAVEGLQGKFSSNAAAVIKKAGEIAPIVSKVPEIHARHLFGALLIRMSVVKPGAEKRLRQLGINVEEISGAFLEFLARSVDTDDHGRWRSLLTPYTEKAKGATTQAPIESFVSGTPGYTSEFCGVGGDQPVFDRLGVESLASRLAELMALRETKLPLAIGLFGNWGSGKSHFMNLMDRRMKTLAATGAEEGPWCKQIVPIYFNAWHYTDANLWASLVTEVFDALFAHLQPKTDQLALLQARLRDAGGVTALAESEVEQAREGVELATKKLTQAQENTESAKQVMKSLLNGLRTLLPELNTSEKARVTELLGVETEAATLTQLMEKRKELESLAGRASAVWKRAFRREGLLTRAAWVIGVLLGVLIVRAFDAEAFDGLLRRLGPDVQAWLAPLSAIAVWMMAALGQVEKGLHQLEKWEKRAGEAKAAMPVDPEILEAREKLVRAEAKAKAAEEALAAAHALELQLTQAASSLMPQRRLSSFIEARARSADYRGQLGLVSLARRDFEELSDIFTDAEALQRRIEKTPDDAAMLKALSLSVDRVVLFIDDLDRCEPEKVVDVLQAVHLLLAYPLFGVVVGVDQRCLKQSLRLRFRGLLTPERGDTATTEVDIPATPLDYLEKIFHVPFHVPAMTQGGFAALVESLTEPVIGASVGNATNSEKATSPDEQKQLHPDAGVKRQAQPQLVQSFPLMKPAPDGPAEANGFLGSVPLSRWERDALKEYYSLIRTPRGATRLLNTYRLVRAGISEAGWGSFRGNQGGNGECRVAMLMLAVAAGQPAVAREWFGLLRGSITLPLNGGATGTERPEWENFRALYGEIPKKMGAPLTQELLVKWLEQVEYFAF